MSPKPIVQYDPRYLVQINLGFGALVKPIDHPSEDVSNESMIMTSPIIKYDGAGCFETANTLYVPREAV